MVPYVAIALKKACPPQHSYWGHQCPQLTSTPTKISQNDMDPDQISATDVSLGPIILSFRRRSLPRRRNKSQPTWAPTKYLQQTSGIPQYPSVLEHLCCQIPRLPLTFPTDSAAARIISQRRRGSLNVCQTTPGISNPASQLLQGRLKYWPLDFLRHVCQNHCSFDSLKHCIVYFICLCGTYNLFR